MNHLVFGIKPTRIQIKKREELLKLGYEDNKDPNDFLNLLAGKELTINGISENGKIFISEEYPNYAIYDISVSNYLYCENEITKISHDYDYTCAEIGKKLNITTQAVNQQITRTMKKLLTLLKNDKENLLSLVG